jgi:cytochrome c biogenesis protein CcmG/thiol:disulfide interchange protein DsbE
VKAYRRYHDRGVAFLGINHEDQVAAATAWVDRYHVPYPSISDQAGRYAAACGYLGLPDTYVVDREGTIRFVISGPTDAAQLSGLLDQILTPKTG